MLSLSSRRHMLSSAFSILILLLILSLLAACGGNAPTQGTTAQSTPTPPPTFTPTPTPDVPRKDITFRTSDKVSIAAWLYGKPSTTAIICSHERGGNKAQWDSIAPVFASHGYMVIAYDFRGLGDSGGEQDLGNTYKDVLAAIDYAKKQGAKKIILLGSSIGTAVSEIAATHTKVDGVISLSPAYYSPLEKKVFQAVTAPKLLINSEGDTYSGETRQMYEDAVGPKELHIYPGSSAHGTSIFLSENRQDLYDRILAFIKKYAPLS
ncbi:alpha/beta hydrolase [Ktedonospora formicarum]|uniref:Serine aminopeptidase S33 domain-containing protein n=1 Tax=Ktedonospora formicarum TaxID=2778364 RepID=A0A8J3I0E3_9CHLR|nr:alpha/beta fold hydrolase [Ktedonospora formicarum]GHO43249.1 hypothetical protein KSX_14120 [Ktedonospora formicarum]